MTVLLGFGHRLQWEIARKDCFLSASLSALMASIAVRFLQWSSSLCGRRCRRRNCSIAFWPMGIPD